jgi:hypothetical protein
MSINIPLKAADGTKSTVTLSDPVVNVAESPPGTAITTVGPTINASPTPGAAGSGNLLAITSGKQVSLNGVVPSGFAATANVAELYYIDHTAFQFNGTNWFAMTATSSGTTALTASPVPTIVLGGNTVPASSPAGTVVGALSVTTGLPTGVGAGAYAWTLALSGTGASNFKLVGSSLETAVANLAAGAYQLTVTATASGLTATLPVTVTVAAAVTSGTFFSISGGNIFTPAGKLFVGGGINVLDFDMASCITNAAGAPLTTLFPGINLIRLACNCGLSEPSYNPPSFYTQFVNWATGLGIVVMIENHRNSNNSGDGGGQGVIFTGTELANESAWYASLATAFINNPLVWFMTNNEPPQGNLAAWHQATYNAIRGTGNNTIIAIESYYGGGLPSDFNATNIPPAVYGPMKNVVWDFHQYAWIVNGLTAVIPQTTCMTEQVAWVKTLQGITTSQDGVIPVIVGESGNSSAGPSIDASGQTLVNAVIANTGATLPFKGAAFWEWMSGAVGDKLLTNDTVASGVSSPYGAAVAAFTATLAAKQ